MNHSHELSREGEGTPVIDIADIQFDTANLDELIRILWGKDVAVLRRRPVGGGSINRTEAVDLTSERRIFVKTNTSDHTGLFEEEARGLRALHASGGPRIPVPYAIGTGTRDQILIMEYIAGGRKNPVFYRELGVSLATLHRMRRNRRCGFDRDNHIGETPQKNGWDGNWFRFFGEKRLIFQTRLARHRGYDDGRMERQAAKLVERLPDILPPLDDGTASLLHGDLWGGNIMAGEDGEPVLIDPAAYFGHREADLAMTRLFGGFGSDFYRSYHETWPLQPGFDERADVYNLYHLLNHLNLFGRSYLESCRSILRRFT